MENPAIDAFYRRARAAVPDLPIETPISWAFGATPAHADSLLALVLDGIKTGTASSLWDLEASGEPVPEVGELSVILDGAGTPRALLRTTRIDIVPFDEVDEEHARSEGEDDRTLASWREIHRDFWTRYAEDDRGFDERMPVVCEGFELLYAEPVAETA